LSLTQNFRLGAIDAITHKGDSDHYKYDLRVMSLLALCKYENTPETYSHIISEFTGMKGAVSKTTKEWILKNFS
jgi:hypothetical protein